MIVLTNLLLVVLVGAERCRNPLKETLCRFYPLFIDCKTEWIYKSEFWLLELLMNRSLLQNQLVDPFLFWGGNPWRFLTRLEARGGLRLSLSLCGRLLIPLFIFLPHWFSTSAYDHYAILSVKGVVESLLTFSIWQTETQRVQQEHLLLHLQDADDLWPTSRLSCREISVTVVFVTCAVNICFMHYKAKITLSRLLRTFLPLMNLWYLMNESQNHNNPQFKKKRSLLGQFSNRAAMWWKHEPTNKNLTFQRKRTRKNDALE